MFKKIIFGVSIVAGLALVLLFVVGTKKLECLTKLAQNVFRVNLQVHQTRTNANHGSTVTAVCTSLPTAQPALTAYAAVVHPSSSPPTIILILAPAGQTV